MKHLKLLNTVTFQDRKLKSLNSAQLFIIEIQFHHKPETLFIHSQHIWMLIYYCSMTQNQNNRVKANVINIYHQNNCIFSKQKRDFQRLLILNSIASHPINQSTAYSYTHTHKNIPNINNGYFI